MDCLWGKATSIEGIKRNEQNMFFSVKILLCWLDLFVCDKPFPQLLHFKHTKLKSILFDGMGNDDVMESFLET